MKKKEKNELLSPGMQSDKDMKDRDPYIMNKEQQEMYAFYRKRLDLAKRQREQVYEEFDDMTYEDDYYENKRALNSYLRRKKNDAEVRIVTGTTEKRIETVVNEVMSMNLQPEIIAFDENDRDYEELGRDLEDIVRRTNEIEQDDDQYLDIIMELVSQRTVFVEELWMEKEIKGRKIKRCEKRLLSGLQVYLGDITLPAYRFNEQPYIVKYEKKTWDDAKRIYGDWDNWKYVKPGNFDVSQTNINIYGYRFSNLKEFEVEILHYMSVADDEYMIMINGVLMFNEPEKTPKWWGEGYNITMVVLKPIHHKFAYGKPLTASAKTLQALDNETIRNLVFKFRQALQPPLGVKTGKIYSKDIWMPGAVVQGVKAGDFERLIDHTGVTPGEMQMFQLIETKVNEFIGTQTLMQTTKRQTATEIMELQKQAIKMLGFTVLAVMRLKRNLTFLRLYNVLGNMTKSTGKEMNPLTKQLENIYQAFTISDGTIDNDKKMKKVVQFMDRNLTRDEKEATYRHENDNNVRFKFINLKIVDELKLYYFVTIINKERDSSALSKAMFTEKFNQAVGIATTVGRPLNADTVIDEYERTWKIKDMFQEAAPATPTVPGAETVGPTDVGSQMQQQNQKPSIKDLAKAGVGMVNP